MNDHRDPTDPNAGDPSGGADAARNGPLRRQTPAGEPGSGVDHHRHESSVELEERAAKGRKPYTAETEAYSDPSLDDPTDPDQRADARRGPIA